MAEHPDGEGTPLWRRAGVLVGHRKGLVVALVIVSAIAGVCESAILALLATIASSLVGGKAKVSLHLGPVHLFTPMGDLILVAFVFAIVRLLVQVFLSYLPARICANIQIGMRLGLFHSFWKAPWALQSADGEGKFQELATSQVFQATQGAYAATVTLSAAVMLAILVVASLVVQFAAALGVIGAGAVLFLMFRPLNVLGRRQARSLSDAQVVYAGGVHDAVNMAEETQVFGVGNVQEEQLRTLTMISGRHYFDTQFLGRLVPGAYQCAVFLLLIAGVALLESTGRGRVASLGAVILLLLRASSYGQQVQGGWVNLYQSFPFIDRLAAAEKSYRATPVIRGTGSLPSAPRSITFEDVSYSYSSGRPVLRGISFEISAGEAVGLVGPTGAGKSTLVQILLGLREPESGRYLVDGKLAQEWSPTAWTRTFAYVSQEPKLLQGTVAENIRFLREIDDDAVVRAAELAHIDREIMSWPHGYDTPISQRAKAVSGGQRQRICLARALAGRPAVLVLDEPTSQLDPRSESLVQQSLEALRGELTLVVVAHRLSTLSLCDRVMVMRAGVLDAFATAEELSRSNEFYRTAASLSHMER